MNLKPAFGIVFLVIGCLGFSQEQRLRGKVVADSIGVSSVTVMNLVNEIVTKTNAQGEFSIMAKADDLLVFSSIDYEYKRRLIETEDLQKGEIIVKLISKPTQLEEVIVYRDINPEDLGIVPKGQKQYTPAERKLKAAGEFKPMAMIGAVAGLSIPVDPIINAITGRTKMLKKYVRDDRKDRLFEKLGTLYEDKHYTEKLAIPADYVEGFRYFLVEDITFATTLQTGIKARIDFQMTLLAQKFNELIALETK